MHGAIDGIALRFDVHEVKNLSFTNDKYTR